MPAAHHQVIYLQQAAPAKPSLGSPCNGCGVCCAAETCPVARLVLRQISDSCNALEWQDDEQRYYCGLARHPKNYLRWLPARLEKPFQRWVLRKISANLACDSDATIE